MSWVMAGVAGASFLSGLSGSKKKKKAQQELINYQRSLRLDPVTGQFGGINVNDGNVDAGAFGDLQSAFSGGAGDVLGGIDFNSGLPPEIASALGLMQSRLSPNVNPMLGGLFRGGAQAGAVGSQGFADLVSGNAGTGDLMAQLFGGASGLADELGQGFETTRANTLSALRERALPEQQRAVDSTLTRLFSQGRLGSTGGANIIGRLAESQNQEDLGFQLAAGNEARAASADVMGRFQSLLGGARGLSEQALGRFVGATGLGADLSTEAFRRQSTLDETGFGRILDNLQATIGAAGLPTELQAGRVGLASQLTGAAGGIQDLINAAFNNALNKSVAGTNVRVAGAGLNTSTMTSPGYSASPVQDSFQSLFTGMLPAGGFNFSNIFSKLGRGRTPGIAGDVDRFQTL